MDKIDVKNLISNPNKLDELLKNATIDSVISYYRFMENIAESEKNDNGLRHTIAAFSVRRFSYLFQTYGDGIWHYLLDVIEDYISDRLDEGEFFTPASNNKYLIQLKGSPEEIFRRLYLYFDEISEKMALDKCHMKVTFACGIYDPSGSADSVSEVIKKSTAAMHRASLASSCSTEIVFYSEEIYKSVVRNGIIEQDLCNAVKNNELIVEIQPKYDMKTGKCVSAEALVRWMHPTLGRIPPR